MLRLVSVPSSKRKLLQENRMEKMKSISKYLLTVICILIIALSGCGKEEPKVYRVGILCGLDYIADIIDSFKTKMTELGYLEGKNVVYDIQRTNFEPTKEDACVKSVWLQKTP